MPDWIIFSIVALALLLAGCAPAEDSPEKSQGTAVTRNVTIDGIHVNAEVADTPQEWEKGLMERDHLDGDAGMLFVFTDETYRSFWMKNTLIPLDIIFIAGNGSIVDIKEDFQPCIEEPCPSYRSARPAMYVLEVNSGFAKENGVGAGDLVLVG